MLANIILLVSSNLSHVVESIGVMHHSLWVSCMEADGSARRARCGESWCRWATRRRRCCALTRRCPATGSSCDAQPPESYYPHCLQHSASLRSCSSTAARPAQHCTRVQRRLCTRRAAARARHCSHAAEVCRERVAGASGGFRHICQRRCSQSFAGLTSAGRPRCEHRRMPQTRVAVSPTGLTPCMQELSC